MDNYREGFKSDSTARSIVAVLVYIADLSLSAAADDSAGSSSGYYLDVRAGAGHLLCGGADSDDGGKI